MVAPALPAHEARLYRSVCMRLNYLAADRPDLQFSTKECARLMSEPSTFGMAKLKKVVRYLKQKPRYVARYEMQEEVFDIACYGDSDHAGCLRTRKSTNWMNLFHGQRWIRGASSTQSVIAMSSGESEFYAIVKAASALLGLLSFAPEL